MPTSEIIMDDSHLPKMTSTVFALFAVEIEEFTEVISGR
jgi:hypothetical protein